ncbi:MAG: hypothetical protein KIT31_35630 [Deltaproteobacteria bacterium]|nr:hypothetical protein [Deltaproteobacteria bacterium]
MMTTSGGFSAVTPMPTMHDLAGVVRDLAAATDRVAGIVQLQRSVQHLLRVSDALCVWIDWPRRTASSISGRVSEQLEELVIEVAGRGRRSLMGSALLEPVGPAPARAVLALRRPTTLAFGRDELAMIGALAIGIAPALDRLVRADPGRG